MSIIRPLNGLIGAISVFIGALLTHQHIIVSQLLITCAVCFLIISAGNVLNDYADVEIDSVNKPHSPISSGRITRTWTLITSIILFAAGIALSIRLSKTMLSIAVLASILLVIYNFNLKRHGLIGNFAVAILGGLPFVYGGILQGQWKLTIIPFLFAFLLHLARELLKDIQDMAGDKIGRVISFPIRYGIKPTIDFAVIVMLILIVFTPVPFILRIYGWAYLISVIIFMDAPLGFLMYNLTKDEYFVPKACNILKLNMVFGLVVLVLGYFK